MSLIKTEIRHVVWIGIIIMVLFTNRVVLAQEEKKHPIDVWLENCIEKDSSTAGMIKCSGKAYEMWDKEMNKVYQKLMKKLSPEEKELLKESQKQWLKFRDAEFKFIDNLYLGIATMIPVMKYGQKLDILKQRTLQLKEYLNDVNDWEMEREDIKKK